MKSVLKSKLVWGAIAAAAGWILQQPHIGVTEVIQAIGGIIAAVGARDAIRKSAPPDSIEGQKMREDGDI